MPRILTPSTHSQETPAIAHELLPTGSELAIARTAGLTFSPAERHRILHRRRSAQTGPEFYQVAPKLKIAVLPPSQNGREFGRPNVAPQLEFWGAVGKTIGTRIWLNTFK